MEKRKQTQAMAGPEEARFFDARALTPSQQAQLTAYYDEYGVALHKYFLKRGVQKEVAEDLSQAVFLKLIRRRDGDKIENPRGYIMQAASSVWIDYLRRRQARPDHDHDEYDDLQHSPASFSPERVLVGREVLKLAMDTLRDLPVRTRQIYLLFHVDGMKRKDLAARMGVTPSAIDKHLKAAKKKLGQVLGDLK